MPSPLVRGLVVLAGLATVGTYVGMFLLSTTEDRVDQLDVEPVRSVASAACTDLRTAVDALPPLPPGATAAQRRERVAEQGRLVDRLVQQVRSVGPEALAKDVPAEAWLADWTALQAARQAWADAGASGTAPVPVADGRPLAERMGAVGLPACLVPTPLTTTP